MVDTTEAVRRDIEVTRERMSSTLAQLERKVNLMQRVRDHPWPALAIALGAGIALGAADLDGSPGPSRGGRGGRRISSHVGTLFDEIVAGLVGALGQLAQSEIDRRLESWKARQYRDQ